MEEIRPEDLVLKARFLDELFDEIDEQIPLLTNTANGHGTTFFDSSFCGVRLFRIQCPNLWVDFLIGNKSFKRQLIKAGKSGREFAKQFVIPKLQQEPLYQLHIAAANLKQKYENAMRTIATNRGVDLDPDVMLHRLIVESANK